MPLARDVVWHEVECAGYSADLPFWEQLTDEIEGPILELGCGTGRVCLHLLRRGHRVSGLDLNASFVASLRQRGAGSSLEVEVADARGFQLRTQFGLVLVPMQLVQLFANEAERVACLSCAASHLRPGGRAALAIVEEMPKAVDFSPPLPDVREEDGWVYSSLPLETVVGDGEIVVRRLRQIVSPGGELSDEVDDVRLRVLSADQLEREAEQAGLRPAGRGAIPPTDAHVGSTVVLLEKET